MSMKTCAWTLDAKWIANTGLVHTSSEPISLQKQKSKMQFPFQLQPRILSIPYCRHQTKSPFGKHDHGVWALQKHPLDFEICKCKTSLFSLADSILERITLESNWFRTVVFLCDAVTRKIYVMDDILARACVSAFRRSLKLAAPHVRASVVSRKRFAGAFLPVVSRQKEDYSYKFQKTDHDACLRPAGCNRYSYQCMMRCRDGTRRTPNLYKARTPQMSFRWNFNNLVIRDRTVRAYDSGRISSWAQEAACPLDSHCLINRAQIRTCTQRAHFLRAPRHVFGCSYRCEFMRST